VTIPRGNWTPAARRCVWKGYGYPPCPPQQTLETTAGTALTVDGSQPWTWSHVGINHEILYDEHQAVYVARAQDRVTGYLGTGLDPLDAVLGLAEKMLEGRPCPNCDRATAIDTINVGVLDELPARESLCWIILDPRTCRYTRDCGADIWT
jgi:hypothetical protein